MNQIHPRISFQPGLNYSFKKAQQNYETSIETKKLIEYLQYQKGKIIQGKLRQEVFFTKIEKTLQKTRDQTKNIQSSKQNISSQQNFFKKTNQTIFANKRSPIGRKAYFSPQAVKAQKINNETPVLTQFQNQFPINDCNEGQKKTFHLNLAGKPSKLGNQLFQSEKQISTSKQYRQCPQFLKRTVKITKKIDQSSEESKIKIEDFIIIKSLGQGTFGEVVQAFHKPTGSVYAIKIYKKYIIKKHQLEEKFIHDIKVQLKMNHPHIVKLYGFFDDSINFYMIFEFMESGNLSKTIEEKGGKMPEAQIYRTIFEINDALLYLHEKSLTHRDIKPTSVLTCLDFCKLCDTEWLQGDVNLPHHTTLCRQLDYMAPEAFEGKQITNEFDVWGLGMIAYELLSGKKLISDTTQKMLIRKIVSLNKELIQILIPTKCSYELKKFIISALQPVPSKRITSKAINQMKLEKEGQITSCFLSNRSISFQQKPTTVSQRNFGLIPRSPPKNPLIFGIKKQLRNEVSTIL